MTVFNGGLKPDMTSGLLNLNSVKQMLFCIAQNESSARELDAYAMLGISNILEDAGNEIEQRWNEMVDKEERLIKRLRKLRAALAALSESVNLVGRSDIAKILADDEKGGSNDA